MFGSTGLGNTGAVLKRSLPPLGELWSDSYRQKRKRTILWWFSHEFNN